MKLEKKTISGKLGKLSCEGVTGTVQFSGGQMIMTVKLENRMHEKSPFGVVSSRWEIGAGSEGAAQMKMIWDLKLIDLGDDAKTTLPDNQ